MDIKRGQIYYANLGTPTGSEQGGYRPVLIIQNNRGNQHAPTTIIAPITSKVGSKHKLPTHCEVRSEGLPLHSMALLEQIRTIDKSRLGEYVDNISLHNLAQIDLAIKISLGV